MTQQIPKYYSSTCCTYIQT